MTKFRYISLLAALFVVTACSKGGSTGDNGSTNTTTIIGLPASFAKGADISWVTQMESAGYKFYNNSGAVEDCFQLMKDKGINAIRLRVWVNPSDGWCNKADLLAKAIRANNLGMKIMIAMFGPTRPIKLNRQPGLGKISPHFKRRSTTTRSMFYQP